MSHVPWFRDRHAWRLIALRYLPWLAGLNLAWEIAHVRFYTLWTEHDASYIAFSIVHCTLGDALIGGLALLLSLIVLRARGAAYWRWRALAVLVVVLGAGYTVFSEWMNISLLRSWTYAESMPTIELGRFELGLTPLAQWLLLPPIALYIARRPYRFSSAPPRGGVSEF